MSELGNLLHDEQSKSSNLMREIDRINIIVRNKTQECENMAQVVQNKERELINFRDIELELNELRKKQAFFTKELDRINGLIS